ncbi:cytochrome b5-like [Olea europaea var. sylvestris]|uniref:cytochrome b5-like n=1 Tax=Olea europaea var. sylvestris TaxID=158386 RepID=UPI000C1D8114|nr:cytochrome b5-like [Olea europaea var. sylvestris]
MAKLYTFEEVSKHRSIKDCWLVIEGKVYDVSPFMDDHPGGDEVLLSSSGKDATADFEDIGHSDSAKEMMDKYLIGTVDMLTVPKKRAFVPPQEVVSKANKGPDFTIRILQFFVPLLILGLTFVVRSYTKEKC